MNFLNIKKKHKSIDFPKVVRVYNLHELEQIPCIYSMWHTKNIDDRPELIDKILNHLKTATDYKVLCSDVYIEFTCKTKKFGYIRCIYHRNSLYPRYFQFCVGQTGMRYEIDYSLKDMEEFKEFLKDMFGQIEKNYDNDLNL